MDYPNFIIKRIMVRKLLMLLLCIVPVAMMGKKEKVAVVDTMLVRGDSLMADFDYYGAAACYEKSVAASDARNVRHKLAECYYRLQRYRDCIECLRPIKQDSLSHTGMRMMYYSYHALEHNDSIAVWGDLIQYSYRRDMEVAVSLARFYNAQKQPIAAKCAAGNYLHYDSLCVPALKQYGYAQYLDSECEDSYQKAIATYDKILKIDNDDFEAVFMKGMCLSMMDSLKLALPYLERAAKMKDYTHAPSVLRLGLVAADLGYDVEARDYLAKAEMLMMPEPEVVYAIKKKQAGVYCNVREYRKAADALLECIRLHPNDALAYYNVSEMFRVLGDDSNYKLYLTKFLEVVPGDSMSTTDEGKRVIEEAKRRLAKL